MRLLLLLLLSQQVSKQTPLTVCLSVCLSVLSKDLATGLIDRYEFTSIVPRQEIPALLKTFVKPLPDILRVASEPRVVFMDISSTLGASAELGARCAFFRVVSDSGERRRRVAARHAWVVRWEGKGW